MGTPQGSPPFSKFNASRPAGVPPPPPQTLAPAPVPSSGSGSFPPPFTGIPGFPGGSPPLFTPPPPGLFSSPPPTKSSSRLTVGVIIGITIGVVISLVVASCVFIFLRYRKRAPVVGGSRGVTGSRSLGNIDNGVLTLPMRVNGVNSSHVMSHIDSTEVPARRKSHGLFALWWGGGRAVHLPGHPGVMKFGYKELQKATNNFTALLGEGSFGPVYKAIQPSGAILAVKILSAESRQGEREFDTEVTLLGRLHHRNLVNLVGYCADRGERMLVYEYMSNGSLAGFLYNADIEPLSWEQRVHIAQDISRGIEYLHDGAIPSVVHRDIKSANILLDGSMTARVADFGLSKENSTSTPEPIVSGVKGTYGYVDPEYILTSRFTDKSDVYSFGVLLFEIITARSPQQGLMEYVHLAALGVEGKSGWGELLDPRLNGQCNMDSLGTMASVAYKCVQKLPKARPKMRTVVQVLSKLGRRRHNSSIDLTNLPPLTEVAVELSELHPSHADSSTIRPEPSPTTDSAQQ